MFKRFLLIALLFVANVFLLETLARTIIVQAKPTLGKTATFDRKFQLANQKRRNKPEVLLMGDSIMHFGVYSELFDTRMYSQMGGWLNSINLASPGATPEMNLLLLKQAVKQNGPPRLVIYNFSPRVFNKNKPPDDYATEFNKSYFNRCFNQANSDFQVGIRCFFEEKLALVRYRNFLQDEMMKVPRTLFQFEQRLAFSDDNSPEREVSPQGWAPAYAVHTLQGLVGEYHQNEDIDAVFQNELGHYVWTTEPIQPFLDYCEKQNIAVVMVWFPAHALIDEYYSRIGLSPQMLAAKLQQFANGRTRYFIDLHDMPMDEGGYADLDHLNSVGAVRVTNHLAEILQHPPYQALWKGVVRR